MTAIEIASLAAGAFPWAMIPIYIWRRPKTVRPPKPKKCSSYKQPHGTILHDCGALRSHVCLDGRCSFHCNQMCKCASPGVA